MSARTDRRRGSEAPRELGVVLKLTLNFVSVPSARSDATPWTGRWLTSEQWTLVYRDGESNSRRSVLANRPNLGLRVRFVLTEAWSSWHKRPYGFSAGGDVCC